MLNNQVWCVAVRFSAVRWRSRPPSAASRVAFFVVVNS